MYLLDTHAWLWLVAGAAPCQAMHDIRADEPWAVPAISMWEIAMLASRGRIVLDLPLAEWLTRALRPDCFAVVPITPAIAVASASLPDEMPGDAADRIIAAMAVVHRATLVTADRRLLDCAERAGYGTFALAKG